MLHEVNWWFVVGCAAGGAVGTFVRLAYRDTGSLLGVLRCVKGLLRYTWENRL